MECFGNGFLNLVSLRCLMRTHPSLLDVFEDVQVFLEDQDIRVTAHVTAVVRPRDVFTVSCDERVVELNSLAAIEQTISYLEVFRGKPLSLRHFKGHAGVQPGHSE